MRGHHTVEDSLQIAAGIFKKQNIAQGSRHSVQGVGLFSFFLSFPAPCTVYQLNKLHAPLFF
jgi:hypothetical protein